MTDIDVKRTGSGEEMTIELTERSAPDSIET